MSDTRSSRSGAGRIGRAVLALAAAAGLSTALAQPAQAEANWEEPPVCEQSFWHVDSSHRPGFYSKIGERTETRLYGGGAEIRYIWIWQVEVLHYPEGMLPAGIAEKVCGGEWKPDHGNIA